MALESGIQLVALNSQNNDIWKLIYLAHFENNEGPYAGYMLKPNYLLKGVPIPSTPIQLTVQVISASNIRFTDPKFSYYVRMALFGSRCENVFGNNFESFINVTDSAQGEEGVFMNSVPIVYSISQPYFAVVALEVTQYGRCAIAVRNLRKGYHVVPLLSSDFEKIDHSFLLLKIFFCTA